MLKISIAKLKPANLRLNGASAGEAHAEQVRRLVTKAAPLDSVVLDFQGIESASASYLKRLLNPFFASIDTPEGFNREISPIAINVDSPDLKEELEDHLIVKSRVLIMAKVVSGKPKFESLLGRLDGAAAETFDELRKVKRATALQLYERHKERTTNQTAWNNRLAQLVDLRVARRSREGRFWIYQPTITT